MSRGTCCCSCDHWATSPTEKKKRGTLGNIKIHLKAFYFAVLFLYVYGRVCQGERSTGETAGGA